MIAITLTPEDPQLAELVGSLEFMSSKMMPHTYQAFKRAVALVQYTWKCYAAGADMGGGMKLKRPTGAYARSIKTRFYAPFNYEVFSDSKVAKFLEEGTKEFDMKKTHPFGKRSRVTKKGQGYLIIPFRHGAPGSVYYPPLPEQVYKQIKAIAKQADFKLASRAQGKKYSPNYKGEMIPRARYKRGTPITGLGDENLEGLMVVNIGATPKEKRSAAVTFRVISENSPAFKWIRPAMPGMHITKHVVENTQDAVKDLIETGLKKDMGIA
ncbi:hypothetical protein LCGC14_1898430 [marine sediment metagenome]|uniref:Uncharacterized protein n=1 Tax=marine sediment metagenome TaxID=412755 RepID=A0A0F9FXB9_9ZZZZ